MTDLQRILENLRGGSYGQIDLNKHDLDSAIRKVKELMEVDPVRKEQQENDLRTILNDLGALEKSDQLIKDITTARYLTGKK